MKPPKPMEPTRRWAIVDAGGVPQWIAPPNRNTRLDARCRLGLFYHSTEGDRVARVRITEVKRA